MVESSQPRARMSSSGRGTIVLRKSPREKSSPFGKVVRALWPDKPALNLAQRSGLTERGAQYLIEGKRKPNARAMLAVNAAMLIE